MFADYGFIRSYPKVTKLIQYVGMDGQVLKDLQYIFYLDWEIWITEVIVDIL